MCGIVGFLRVAPTDHSGHWICVQRLQNACDALTHRGPDGQGIWHSGACHVGLGHRRLAVHGGVEAIQPIESEDGSIVCVVNGELYDPDDATRRSLIQRGHRFRTGGDSELALHLYEEYGLGFVDHLRGEYAILLWDAQHQRLVAVRDRFGIKPLVYTRFEGQWWFASQIRALAAAGAPMRPDQESVWHAMSFQYTLPDRTLSENILQLPPGHLGVCNGDSIGVRSYWDMNYPTKEELRSKSVDPDDLFHFGELLDESVRVRLRGDVEIVAHLSGGIDSASVLESAVRQGSVSRAFTIGFQNRGEYDESSLAMEVARVLQIPWEPVPADVANLVESLPTAVDYSEGWCVNGHLPAKYALNAAIHQAGFKVALTGEGADELLAGYPHLRIDHHREWGNARDADRVYHENSVSRGIMLPSGRALDVSSIRRELGFVPSFLVAKASLGSRLHVHLKKEFLDQFVGRDPYQELLDATALPGQLRDRTRMHQSLYLWNKTALPQYILRTLGDGCESAHAVEGRLPMLDHRLFEFVKRLPLAWLISSCHHDVTLPEEKRILRESVSGRIPRVVVERSKHPFVAPPLSDAMNGKSKVRDLLHCAIDEHPWFEPESVRKTLKEISFQSRSVQVSTDPLWWTVLSSSRLLTRDADHFIAPQVSR